MPSFRHLLFFTILVTFISIISNSTVQAQKRKAPVRKKSPAPVRKAKVDVPLTPAIGGGDSSKTEEEAEAMLESGEKYADPAFETTESENQAIESQEVQTEDDTLERVDVFFAQLADDPTARGVIINYGTNREMALREAEIIRAIKMREYDLERIKFLREAAAPGIRTRYFIVPEGAEDPAADEDQSIEENSAENEISTPENSFEANSSTAAKRVNVGIMNNRAISLISPAYPEEAVNAGASGEVRVQIVIDQLGYVISTQSISGHPQLRKAAEKAAQQSRFEPVVLNGRKVIATGIVVYNFINQ